MPGSISGSALSEDKNVQTSGTSATTIMAASTA